MGTTERIALAWAIASLAAIGQTPPQPSKEYIYLGGRMIAVESYATTPQAPVVNGVTPTDSMYQYGAPATYSFTFSDPNGWENIAWAQSMTNTQVWGYQSCHFYFAPSSNIVWLGNDNGMGWVGGAVVGTQTALTNSQCTIEMSGSTVQTAGATLTLSLRISFKPEYAGSPKFWVYAGDLDSLSSGGPIAVTSVTVPGNLTPIVVSTTASPTGGSQSTFSVTVSDPNGWKNIRAVYFSVEDQPVGVNPAPSCRFVFIRAKGELWLADDQSGWQYLNPVPPGSGTAQNSRCKLQGTSLSAAGSGTDLTLTFQLEFFLAHTGVKRIWADARDIGGLNPTGSASEPAWVVAQNMNTNLPLSNQFAIQFGQPPGPAQISPMNQAFTMAGPQTNAVDYLHEYSDPDGWQNLHYVQSLTGIALSGMQSCYYLYFHQNNGIYLVADDGRSWMAGQSLPLTADYSNSQCTLHAGTTFTGTGNNLTLKPKISYKSWHAGYFGVWMWATDLQGWTQPWLRKTDFTVPGNTVPSTVSVAPNPASGASTLLSITFSDANGYQNLRAMYFAVAGNPDTGPVCRMVYMRPYDELWLTNEGLGWQSGTPLKPGVTGLVENSVCRIDGGTSFTRTASGNTITLSVPITFKSVYAGSKKVWAAPYDIGGGNPGGGVGTSEPSGAVWQDKGGYEVSFVTTMPQLVVSPQNPSQSTTSGATTFSATANLSPVSGVTWSLSSSAYNPITFANINSSGILNITGQMPSDGVEVTVTASKTNYVSGSTKALLYLTGVASQTDLAPKAGIGMGQQFKFWRPSSEESSPTTQFEYMLFNNVSSSTQNSCYMVFAQGVVYLANDASSGFDVGLTLPVYYPTTPPTPTTAGIENSQCKVQKQDSYTYMQSPYRYWNLSLSFKASFVGYRNIYVRSGSSYEPGPGTESYQRLGTWEVK